MKNISVLGCGWLGFPLAKKLSKLNYKVKGSTTSLSKINILKENGISPFIINIKENKGDLSTFLQSEILIIAVPPYQFSNNNFIQLMEKVKASDIQYILHVSSTSAYANDNQTKTEDSPVQENQVCEIEKLLSLGEKTFTIVRFGGLIGDGRNPYNFLSRSEEFKNSEGFINYIHQDDCVQIITEIIQQNKWNKTFNAVASTHPKRIDFYNTLREKRGLSPITPTTKESHWKIIDNSYLKKTLNYSFIWDDVTEAALAMEE
ncbi:hypothetical protein KRX57_05250 [Weeksellaceae bacterium TAE3-ERU29]|nr:hypothetical protein [Weeksellaceae bacterium TAE3-ERU29]